MSAKAGRGSDQFMVRLPDGMRDQIKEMAESNGRSMNAEVVIALQSALDHHDYLRSLEKHYDAHEPDFPKPGDMIDGEVVPEATYNFVRTREDVERVVQHITEESARRMRREFLKIIAKDME